MGVITHIGGPIKPWYMFLFTQFVFCCELGPQAKSNLCNRQHLLPRYVSDPESTALASGFIALLMSLCFLHHFQTITDTIAFCRGLQNRASKYAEEPEGDGCCECWGKDSRETEKLLRRWQANDKISENIRTYRKIVCGRGHLCWPNPVKSHNTQLSNRVHCFQFLTKVVLHSCLLRVLQRGLPPSRDKQSMHCFRRRMRLPFWVSPHGPSSHSAPTYLTCVKLAELLPSWFFLFLNETLQADSLLHAIGVSSLFEVECGRNGLSTSHRSIQISMR